QQSSQSLDPNMQVVPEGMRNRWLTSQAGRVRNLNLTREGILNAIRDLNQRCVPPLPEADLQRIAESISSYPVHPPESNQVLQRGAPMGSSPSEEAKHQPKSEPKQEPFSAELSTVRASDVIAEVVDWLWDNHWALGEINLLVGMPELGKG